jgi:hypothetical protein
VTWGEIRFDLWAYGKRRGTFFRKEFKHCLRELFATAVMNDYSYAWFLYYFVHVHIILISFTKC